MSSDQEDGNHAGPKGEHVSQRLSDALGQGRPLDAGTQAHLLACPACRSEWELLSGLQDVLLEEAASPPVAPPPELRASLLSRAHALNVQPSVKRAESQPELPLSGEPAQMPVIPARVSTGARSRPMPRTRPPFPMSRFPLPRLALGAAAVVAALTAGSLLLAPPGLAHALPDPAVVVNAGGALLVASNGAQAGDATGAARLSLITGERVSATLDVASVHPAWFTEGVRQGDRVYLADAANDRVLEVQTRPLKLLRSYPVGGGVAGLNVGGGRVYFKSVSGEVGLLPSGQAAGRSVALANEGEMPMPDVMDAVLLQGGTLYVTHHLRGELCLLDPQTLAVRKRLKLGGAPVALAGLPGGLLVLDVKGRLLRLNEAGQVLRRWALPGQPDKLVLNGERAVATDRAGRVSQLDLNSGVLSSVTLKHPMDLSFTDDGALAVAQGQTGVLLLGDDLKAMPGGDIR